MAGKNSRPNGKGDQPRKVNGPKYRDNYDSIKWHKSPTQSPPNFSPEVARHNAEISPKNINEE